MKNETNEEFVSRIKREAEIRGKGYRCGECSRISYYRDGEQWECAGSYQNPSSPACHRFKLSEGKAVPGTFPDGVPARVLRREAEAYTALAEKARKPAWQTNYEHVMKMFEQDMDLLIDYMQCMSCCDCEHENECPHSYKGDLEGCREYLRKWLLSPYEG